MQRWYYLFLPRSARSTAWLSILLVFAISFLALFGWVLDIPLLKSIKPQWIGMSSITAALLVLSAVQLVLIQISPSSLRRSMILQAPAMLVVIVGLLTIVLYFIPMITGQEPSLVGVPVLNLFWGPVTRIELLTAIIFLLSGCALVLIASGSHRAANIAHALMLPAAALSYLVPVTYLFGIQTVHGWLWVPVALTTGIAFCALSVAIFSVRPETRLMSVLTYNNAGGVMARRLLPALLMFPLLTGWLHLYAERTGALVAEVNVALAAVAITFFLMALVWLSAASLNRAEFERRQAEMSLRESEERFREAMEATSDGLWDWDVTTGKVYYSPAYFRMLGYERGSLPDEVNTWLELVHPDDRERAWAANQACIRNDVPTFSVEFRMRSRDGTWRWILGRGKANRRGPEGRALRMIGTHTDITERKNAEEDLRRAHDELEQRVKERTADLKQTAERLLMEIEDRLKAEAKLQESEARFRSAFDQSPVGAVIADLDFRFQRVNPAFCRNSGYTAKELSSMAVTDIVHPDDLPRGLEEMRRFITGEIDTFRLEERNIRKDGAVIWVDVSANLIKDSDDRPRYYIGIVQDVNARKQAEEALRESEERLSFLSKQLITVQEAERQRLGLELHEDLGQLLTLLKLQLRAVHKSMASEPAKTRDDVENILTFINEIIERVRRLSRNLMPSILEDLGLTAALESLFNDFQKYYGLKLTMDLDDIKDLFPRETQIVIYRIFQESLTNVAKHSKATEVSVSINREEGRVAFQMEDNGSGFELQQMLGSDFANRGLGLAAIDERVRMLGGVLKLESEPGHGTHLHFTIPVGNQKL